MRWRMECRRRERVRATKGIWKTLAERLGASVEGFQRERINEPVADDAHPELLYIRHCKSEKCATCSLRRALSLRDHVARIDRLDLHSRFTEYSNKADFVSRLKFCKSEGLE